jgi:hypothetical protein
MLWVQGMPGMGGVQGPLRRHGDEVERLPGGFFVAHGRCDDTMNLGGIKVCIALPCCCTPMCCLMFNQAFGLHQYKQIDTAPASNLEPSDAAYSSCPDCVV